MENNHADSRYVLTRKTVELVPREPGRIAMYVCGVTPYAPAHIGHARTAVVYDLLKRYLRHAGYAVTHASNYTDIDDKIIRRAQEQGVAPLDLSARYIREYLDDMAALNVLPPDNAKVWRALDIIDLMVAMLRLVMPMSLRRRLLLSPQFSHPVGCRAACDECVVAPGWM